VEFGFMMKSLQRTNPRLLEKLGAPLARNPNSSAGGGRSGGGGDLMLAWRLESFAVMDKNKSGGVSCAELAAWLAFELAAGEASQAAAALSRGVSSKSNRGGGGLRGGPGSSSTEPPYRRVDDRALPPLVKAADLVSAAVRAGRRLVQQRNNTSRGPAPQTTSEPPSPASPKTPLLPKSFHTPNTPGSVRGMPARARSLQMEEQPVFPVLHVSAQRRASLREPTSPTSPMRNEHKGI
jgi:hypothetical protein